MAWAYDEDTRKITQPRGDTMTLTFVFEIDGATLKEGDLAIFGVTNGKRMHNITFFHIVTPIQNNAVTFRISNAMTRDMKAGVYYYDVRIVTDPAYDDMGNIVADDEADNVISLYSGQGSMPEFEITGVSVRV